MAKASAPYSLGDVRVREELAAKILERKVRCSRRGWTSAPGVNGRTGFEVIKAQVSGGHHFRQHDDLTGVHREMFGDVEDRFQHVDVRALNRAALKQHLRITRGEISQGRLYINQRRAQQSHQFITFDHVALRKLRVAIAIAGRTANTAHYPLPSIAAKVQHQIANAV